MERTDQRELAQKILWLGKSRKCLRAERFVTCCWFWWHGIWFGQRRFHWCMRHYQRFAILLFLALAFFVIVVPFSSGGAASRGGLAWWMAISASLLGAFYLLVVGGIRVRYILRPCDSDCGRHSPGQYVAAVGIPGVAFLAGVTVYQSSGGKLPSLALQTWWISVMTVPGGGIDCVRAYSPSVAEHASYSVRAAVNYCRTWPALCGWKI